MSMSHVALSPSIDVHVVPILSDNFSYLIHDKPNKVATLVDPAEPRALISLSKNLDARITTSLTTHHHWDHAGGNAELASLVPGVEIVGSAYETAEAVTLRLNSGATHNIKDSSLVVSALRTPCHTNGHLCFTTDTDRKAVFTGDTLFVGGCGKFFEGSATEMENSLNVVLAALQNDTLVFCGHEYTLTNLLFASSVEPENDALKEKLIWVRERLASSLPTVPSTIGDEKSYNPFMRTSVSSVATAVGVSEAMPVQVMKALREKKNAFRV